MTSETNDLSRPSSSPRLLVATRGLAAAHAVLGAGMVGVAVFLFIGYAQSSDEDSLAGVALIIGAVYVVLGGIVLALGVGARRARRPKVAYGLGLAAGLLMLLAAGPSISLVLVGVPAVGFVLGIAIELAALALCVCSLVGLVSQSRS